MSDEGDFLEGGQALSIGTPYAAAKKRLQKERVANVPSIPEALGRRTGTD